MQYLLLVLAVVPLSWIALAALSIVPGIVIGLVYEGLSRVVSRQQLVVWLSYAMAGFAALPSSALATQAQFERDPFIWVPAALVIGIATVELTLRYRQSIMGMKMGIESG